MNDKTIGHLMMEVDKLWKECVLVIHPESEKEYFSQDGDFAFHCFSTKNFGYLEDLSVGFWDKKEDKVAGRLDYGVPNRELILNIWSYYEDKDIDEEDQRDGYTRGLPSEWRRKYIALLGLMLVRGFEHVKVLFCDDGGPPDTVVEALQVLLNEIENLE